MSSPVHKSATITLCLTKVPVLCVQCRYGLGPCAAGRMGDSYVLATKTLRYIL